MDNSIIPIIKELERVYDALAKIFELKHDRPVITIQTKGRQNALGWHWADTWERNKKSISEINICAEDLNKDPIETLIHEMAHHVNNCEQINDCNDSGYHNKLFKERAEKYGLNVEKSGRHGWGITSLSDSLKGTLNTLKIDYKVFELFRKTHVTVPVPTKMKKWSCGCTTIRCATNLEAKCLKCNNTFEVKE
jgi:hypothetical protein